MQVRYLGLEDPWRRKWQFTPVFLPRESHGQRNLAGYSPWSWRVRHNRRDLASMQDTIDCFTYHYFSAFRKIKWMLFQLTQGKPMIRWIPVSKMFFKTPHLESMKYIRNLSQYDRNIFIHQVSLEICICFMFLLIKSKFKLSSFFPLDN